MAYKDLRQYIDTLLHTGEAQPIDVEVDWNLEVGAIIRRSYEIKAAAPFFQNLKGYPKGYRIFGAPIGTSSRSDRRFARLAISLGLAPETGPAQIIEEYLERKKRLIKPVMVSDGPCKERVQVGNDVNLYDFPAPYLHGGDGGRYIGTWCSNLVRDPDTGWVNWGMYRLMIHDEKTMGGLMLAFQHIGYLYYQKYEPRGQVMEFAVAIGTEPVTPVVSASKVAEGIDEAEVIGGIRGEPLELIRCETVNLAVPATSEIVIEGEVLPYERRDEGPFGEYTGYLTGGKSPKPVYHVKAITHRRDPILPVVCPGVPVDDNFVTKFTSAAEILDDLRKRHFPVRMVYRPPEGVGSLTLVSTKVPYPNYPRYLATAVWGSEFGRTSGHLIIVEDDVDVTNMEEVLWGLATRCHPKRGIFLLSEAIGIPLMPYLSPYEREHYLGANVLFDCTWPKDWPKEAIPLKASFETLWPPEIRQRVVERWGDYGYPQGA